MNAQQPIARPDAHARERLANWLALLALLAIGIVWPFAEGAPGGRARGEPADAAQATARAVPDGRAARLALVPGRRPTAPRPLGAHRDLAAARWVLDRAPGAAARASEPAAPLSCALAGSTLSQLRTRARLSPAREVQVLPQAITVSQ